MGDTAASVGIAIMATVLVFGIRHLADKLRERLAGREVPVPELATGRVIVTGLSAAEARKVLVAFAKLYDLDADTFAVSDAGEAMQVTWKRPITTDNALYLVNYLAYPADDTLTGRKPEAVGVIAVPADNAPEGVAPGTLAKIYVPEGDTEYDLVHALLADGRAFRVSFTRMTWQPTDTPRATPLVAKVAFSEAP